MFVQNIFWHFSLILLLFRLGGFVPTQKRLFKSNLIFFSNEAISLLLKEATTTTSKVKNVFNCFVYRNFCRSWQKRYSAERVQHIFSPKKVSTMFLQCFTHISKLIKLLSCFINLALNGGTHSRLHINSKTFQLIDL